MGSKAAGAPAPPKDATAAEADAPVVTTITPAERRKRARAAAEAAKSAPKVDPRTRYTLSEGTDWQDLPDGGCVGVAVTDKGVEFAVEITSGNRVRKGVGIIAIATLEDAGYL
jgi:hypothetical protein